MAPAADATTSLAPTTGTKSTSGSGSTDANTQPCDLLTQSMAGQILGKTVPAADINGPTMCEYSMSGADYGNSVALAIEKWQDGRTVQDEVRDLDIVGSDGNRTQQSVSGLSPDAVVVSDDSDITVMWKAGDVQKMSLPRATSTRHATGFSMSPGRSTRPSSGSHATPLGDLRHPPLPADCQPSTQSRNLMEL
ncbi:hypothetical protein ACFZDK_26150 [Streptomyces sp. NPDC007901]|uniref:hypothetical protein n=1 Tax=Streptomyces sp. NPDC007901 TaxID=3364785 RepID=UPI0036E6DDF3